MENTEKIWPAASFVVAGTQFLRAGTAPRWGEIDIVARDDDTLVFVEVKTRRSTGFGGPLAAVNFTKQRRLINMARSYLMGVHPPEPPCRFDVVGVILVVGERPVIEVVVDAFG